MNFEVGIYYYKNCDNDNDNGRIINVIKTTNKSMVYNIGNYYDGDFMDNECLTHGNNSLNTIRKNTRDKIILYSNTYYPQDASGYLVKNYDNIADQPSDWFYWRNLPSN